MIHYLIFGRNAAPNALFDAAYYRKLANLNPNQDAALHYLQHGWRQGYDAHPFFDGAHYLFAYPDVATADIDPLSHYLSSGASEARRPNALFKPDFYVQAMAGVKLPESLSHYFDNADDTTHGHHAGEKLRLRGPVRRIDDYARSSGGNVIDVPQDRKYSWQSPHIINRDIPQTELHATLPAPYVAVMKNITAFPGARVLMSQDKQILHDELASEDAPSYLDKLKAIGGYSDGVCSISAVYIGLELKSALLISSDTDFNYFHMLIETLPKLRLAEIAGCPADIPILIQGDLHPNLVTALERAAKGRQIVYAPWGSAIPVDELWYVSDLSRILNTASQPIKHGYDVVISPYAVRDTKNRLLQGRVILQGNRKIYMSRNSSYRHLKNQDEFMAMLAAKGFEIIDTGRMTLDEQIEAMTGAKMVIAPTGAALTNLLWCPEGASILVLVSDSPLIHLNLFNQIGEALGQHVEFCTGNRIRDMSETYSFHDSFEADLNVIEKWCERQHAVA